MEVGTGDLPSHKASRSKVTNIGAVLRRTKLDELPQIINVLAGEMSFVGPRPCLPTQIELIVERERLGVAKLRPGITGVSQLAGLDMSDPAKLAAMDATYLQNAGLVVDMLLMAKTAVNKGAGDALSN
jgi:O-antigen biosynthesis protein WbqP